MRTSLCVSVAVTVAVALAVSARRARAQDAVTAPRARAGVTRFSDDLGTTVVSPYVSAGARLPGEIETDLGWEADVISSASVDVVSAATHRMTELRNQVAVTAARETIAPDLDVHAGYTFSIEKDAYSHIVQAGAERSFLQDDLVIGVQYGLSYNRLGLPTESSSAWHRLWVNNLDVSLVVVLDPHTELDVLYSGAWNSGFQESPYRRVPVNWRDDLRGAQWVEESVPDTRIRHAVTGRVRHAFGSHVLGYLDYRFYADSWSVIGHTVDARVAVLLGNALTFELRGRGAFEGAASFYERRYETVTELRTRDRRLGTHFSLMGGAAILWPIGPLLGVERLDLRVGVEEVAWHFDEYTAIALTATGDATQRDLGWVHGMVANVGLEGSL